MEPSWHQNRVKNRYQLRRAIFWKSCSRCSGGSIFEDRGAEVATKTRSKIEAQDGLPLGIDFWWILVDFGRQVGVEKRAKSKQKSSKKRIEKMMKKMSVLEAPGGVNLWCWDPKKNLEGEVTVPRPGGKGGNTYIILVLCLYKPIDIIYLSDNLKDLLKRPLRYTHFRMVIRMWILCASRNPTSPALQSTNGSLKKEQLKKVPKLQATRDANRDQKLPKWTPKTFKMEAQTLQNRAQIGPRGVQDDQQIEK